MIGNDIVDLQLAEIQSDWRRKGWLQKIFTQSEQHIIEQAENKNYMVWKLWSMKEAAYKAHQRRFLLPPIYNPWEYVCTDTKVTIHNYQYKTVSKSSKKYIHTVAYLENSNFISKVCINTSDQYKNKLKQYIAKKHKTQSSAIHIYKDENGIPNIKIGEILKNIPFSLSSDGAYTAFCIA